MKPKPEPKAGRKRISIVCKVCGKHVENVAPNQLYCGECAYVRKLAAIKEAQRRKARGFQGKANGAGRMPNVLKVVEHWQNHSYLDHPAGETSYLNADGSRTYVRR